MPPKSTLARLGISIDKQLLEKFDRVITAQGYKNRSKAISDLMRGHLTRRAWRRGKQAVGTITLIYDHHASGISDRLTDLQHKYHGAIVSNLHVHLDAHRCLEVLVVRARSNEIQVIADQLISARGVEHGDLVCALAGAI